MSFEVITVDNEERLRLAFDIRRRVYIVEQSISEDLEFDGLDGEAQHYLLMDGGVPVGTCRIRYLPGHAKLERFAVLEEKRGKGGGSALVEAAIRAARGKGCTEARLDAQVRAIGFYERFGFNVISEKFMDAGIPHVKMSLRL